MSKSPEQIALSELRRKTKRYVRKVHEGGGPIAITRRGERVAVLVSIADFQKLASRKSVKAKRLRKPSANGPVKKPRTKKAAAAE